MPVLGWAGAFLLQSAAGTVAVGQSAPGGRILGVIAMIAIAVIGLTLVALVATLVPALLELRRAATTMEAMLDRLGTELDPIIGHARSVADNADYISTAVRADVGRFRNTLGRANDGLDAAVDASERRVRELGALLRLLQDEVEQTFVSGTSMLRGVRVGADALRHGAAGLLNDLDYEDDEELEDEDDFESDDEYELEDDEEYARVSEDGYDDASDEELIDGPGDLPERGMMLDAEDSDGTIDDTHDDGEETDDGNQWTRDGGDGGDGSEARPRIRHRPS